jgi:hypothetical protein
MVNERSYQRFVSSETTTTPLATSRARPLRAIEWSRFSPARKQTRRHLSWSLTPLHQARTRTAHVNGILGVTDDFGHGLE